MSLAGKHIVVGVGGGIAAYRVGDVVRELRRRGAEVRVAMTQGAQAFVAPLTFQSLSGNPVFTELLDASQDEGFGHLQLARWADAMLVAPATADLLARIRAGMGNDGVTSALLAFRGPVVLAPAMNTAMWENEQCADNVAQLLKVSRLSMVGPASGALADGDVGMGRLAPVESIVRAVEQRLAPKLLAHRKVLVTAGPTREHADPVRFISNPSTGKMGLAVAEAARDLGASVTVVLGPSVEATPSDIEVIRVTTAEEMLAAVLSKLEGVDVFVAAAAVSDWRPTERTNVKAKKGAGPQSMTLERTPDVLATVSERVQSAVHRPLMVGFAAETNDVVHYAKKKLVAKKLDVIVANDVSRPGSGFASSVNHVVVVDSVGNETSLEGSKREVAQRLWALLLSKAPNLGAGVVK